MLDSIFNIINNSWFLEGTLRLLTILIIQLIIVVILRFTPVRDAINERNITLSIVFELVTFAISWVISINFIEITVSI